MYIQAEIKDGNPIFQLHYFENWHPDGNLGAFFISIDNFMLFFGSCPHIFYSFWLGQSNNFTDPLQVCNFASVQILKVGVPSWHCAFQKTELDF